MSDWDELSMCPTCSSCCDDPWHSDWAAREALLAAADEINDAGLHGWANPARGAAVWLRARADEYSNEGQA